MKTFKETYSLNAGIEDVYAALTNPVTIELWSGYPAVMELRPGSLFSLWEGDIEGMIIELQENKKIVQEWFFGEQEGRSLVTIILIRDFGKTQLTIEHNNIPDDAYDNITTGWSEYIIGAIEQFLNPNF
ncbi:MAG TPA: ATPase [Bacteroidales bacterium]|nr:ATPase [Bacteroidales bacterium]